MITDIVSRLYDAAAGEDDFNEVIDGVRSHIGAEAIILGTGDPRAPESLEMWDSRMDWNLHAKHGYLPSDCWDPNVNPAIPAGMIMPLERSFDHRQVIPEETLLRSEFTQQTVYSAGFRSHRLFVPMRDASNLSGGFVSKGKNRDFENDEITRMDYLLPHLGRAMRMRQQLARHSSVELGLSGLLDQMQIAVILIDRDLIVLFCNSVSEQLARTEDGLSILHGKLSLGRGTPALLQALADMDRDDLQSGSPPAIPIARPLGAPPIVARIYPGTGFAGVARSSRVAAAVIFEVPRETALPESAALQSAYGLTSAEAAVARLVPRAGTRRAIAEALGLSENTVKTHLSSIRAKTGARNQVELAQMIQRQRP